MIFFTKKKINFIRKLFSGYCTLAIVVLFETYYMVVVGWCIFYLYQSFFPSLKWGTCDNEWNTDMCNSLVQDLACQEGNNGTITDMIFFNQTCREVGSICQQYNLDPLDGRHCWNTSSSSNMTIPEVIPRVFSSEEFFL